MAYDLALASRVRDALGDNPEISEREMFGGIAFMLSGNMAVGVRNEDLMVRINPDDHDEALARPGVRVSDMGGRPMGRGWILVGPDAITGDTDLHDWIEAGIEFAATFPPK